MEKIHNLIDKIVGKQGNLRVPAYWMNYLLKTTADELRKEMNNIDLSKYPTWDESDNKYADWTNLNYVRNDISSIKSNITTLTNRIANHENNSDSRLDTLEEYRVGIQHLDGTIYEPETWSRLGFEPTDANGVCVYNKGEGFVISPQIYDGECMVLKNATESFSDRIGLENTEKLLSLGETNLSNISDFIQCINYQFPNGNFSYLPSIEEFHIIYRLRTEINTAGTLIGHNLTFVNPQTYVSSSTLFYGSVFKLWCLNITERGYSDVVIVSAGIIVRYLPISRLSFKSIFDTSALETSIQSNTNAIASLESTKLSKTEASSTYASNSTVSRKQDMLYSGTNIKTINGESVLGSGNITIDTSVLNATGNSTEKAMSQKAVTDALVSETDRAVAKETALEARIEAHESITEQAAQNASEANAYAQQAYSRSTEAINTANTAKNAVATLEGLSNTTTAQQTLAATVTQIEQNTTDVNTLKSMFVYMTESEYEALALKDPDKIYMLYEE